MLFKMRRLQKRLCARRPLPAFAAPRGGGPAIGRESSQAAIASSTQAREFGASMKPTGNSHFSMRFFSWARLVAIPTLFKISEAKQLHVGASG